MYKIRESCLFYIIINQEIMGNNSNLELIPIATYVNPDRNKFIIYKENRNKSGIYR